MGKTSFLALFAHFWGNENFFEISGFDMHNFTWFSITMPKIRKTNNQIPRKLPERRTDGETLFHRTLLATAGGPIKNFDSLPTD